ncbi:pyridoxal-dependent decarboxylase [Zychaea mexicana]|uniref:pyridoxal-dependent decarboxylase n=1 Tax=Zychaea mexicana TaxID=64656 RepID=UPI0022FEAC53|nr:pyridoxal-dependent decarboxylase [Zychaea mexicana]KAI9492122.1 pyridoxal-dependent decarboxylase [Zychaea mexicana]
MHISVAQNPISSKTKPLITATSTAEHRIERSTDSSTIDSDAQNGKDDVIHEAIKKKLATVALDNKFGQDDCFYIVDLGQLHRQYLRWKKCFPKIKPYYAVKCNPDPRIIQYLASLGTGFDCASGPEMKKVIDLGVKSTNIIYAHTCKQASYLRYAADHGVAKMTFDNIDELYKIKTLYPKAQLLLRILTDDSKAQWGIGIKYGAPLSDVNNLLNTAKELELDLVGVSFHVGSGCSDTEAYKDTLKSSRLIFDRAKNLGFKNFNLLDIGGGFFGVDYSGMPTFEQIAFVIHETIDSLFPSDIEIMAEPGRYFATSTLTVCCQVVGRKLLPATIKENGDDKEEDKKYMYYVNDSLHASFATRLFYSDVLNLKVLMKGGICMYGQEQKERTYSCSVWGHTCEPGDCLTDDTQLPILNIGDWIYAENMGAYAIATSHFCGFERPKTVYVNSFIE